MDISPLNGAEYTSRNVAYTGTAGSTGTWPVGGCRGVLVWSTTDAYIRVGYNVTATTADTPIPAYTPLTFAVPGVGQETFRVSAIQVSAGGTVYAKPVGGA